ncbi:MAG: hypothetical protein QXR02_07445 [Acidilobaceae archaeon]
MIYKKHILASGIIGLALALIYSIIAKYLRDAHRLEDMIIPLTLAGLTTSIIVSIALTRVYLRLSEGTSPRGVLVESSLAQLLAFLALWTAIYNLIK